MVMLLMTMQGLVGDVHSDDDDDGNEGKWEGVADVRATSG